MANRKWHLITAIVVYIIYCVMYWYIDTNDLLPSPGLPDMAPLWLITGFLMALIGAEAPDWDLLLNWMHHRDIATHSIGIPLIITGTFLVQKLMTPDDPTLVLALIFAPFLLGFGSHLLLDLFPSVDPEREIKEKGITKTTATLLGGFVSGLTGVETIKALQGTYLIHLPLKLPVISEKEGKYVEMRKTYPKHLTRWWLFFNGLISGLLGITLVIMLVWG
ncbi:MAG: hypothetical protein ACXADY_01410 [Candidatus Hodarchaeales archaeon]|jgi:uncharacterized membrane protein YfcA